MLACDPVRSSPRKRGPSSSWIPAFAGMNGDSTQPVASRKQDHRAMGDPSDAFRPPRSPLSLLHPNASRAIGRPYTMTISMYKASVPVFVQFLTSLSAVLDKAAAYAEAKKVEPAVLLNTRLAPDMFPLLRQVRAATDHAINACGRLAGADMPSFSNAETTIPEPKDRIAKTIALLKSLKPAQIDGSEGKAIKITFPSGATREFTGQSLLLTNALPNFYFHCTTAYDILRQCGIELGKRDFMGTPVSL